MRVHAILSWYEEPASWLAATVASLQGVADHIVAVDGAYHLTPGSIELPRSGREQADAITAVAHSLGMGLTLVLPEISWGGNEVEKRNAAFQIANTLATEGEDWFLVIDADEAVTSVPFDFRAQLEAMEENVVACTSWTRYTDHPPADLTLLESGDQGIVFDPIYSSDAAFRKLYRADSTLRVVGAHYVYVAGPVGDPRYLWGHQGMHRMEPCGQIAGLKIEHRSKHRGHGRRRIQAGYYERRDALSVESLAAVA